MDIHGTLVFPPLSVRPSVRPVPSRVCTVNMEPYIMYVLRYQSICRNSIIDSTKKK